jgi:hypothetical protein
MSLALQIALRRRLIQHDLAHPTPLVLPFLPATEGSQYLEGIAAHTSMDLVRTKFKPFCFTWGKDVKLLYRHDEVAGNITSLNYDAQGNVKVTCEVSHTLARRSPGFSVGATVKSFAIINGDTPNFYALINEAVIDEVSLTPSPANLECKVTSRTPAFTAHRDFCDAALAKVANMMKLVTSMKEKVA